MTQLYTNNASGTLATELTDSQNSLTLQPNEGQLFPDPSGDDFYIIAVEDTAGNIEIIQVDGTDNDDLVPLTRARENTIALTFPPGSRVELRVTVGTLDGFLQKSGGIMTGTLDMDDKQITDPVIVGGEARNMPLRGADGGTANQIVVPTSAGDPTIGSSPPNIILHKGNDDNELYARVATTVVANLPITESGGDLGSNLIFGFTPQGLTQIQGNALESGDEIVVFDSSAGVNKAIKYDEAGVPVISAATENIVDSMANTFRKYAAAATVTFQTGDIEIGTFIMFQQLNSSGQVTLAGSTLRASNGLKTRAQYSVIVALKISSTEFAIFGDTVV